MEHSADVFAHVAHELGGQKDLDGTMQTMIECFEPKFADGRYPIGDTVRVTALHPSTGITQDA